MADGLLLGVMLFLGGLACGAGLVWSMVRYHDNERMKLYQSLGMLQGRLIMLQELEGQEVSAKDLGLD